jgi:hypothetical protein
MEKIEFSGKLKSTMYWIIPVILGIGIKKINDGKKIYSLQITPFIEISFSYMGTLNGSLMEAPSKQDFLFRD